MVEHLLVLAVFYIGLPRFRDRTRDNHAWIQDQLRTRFGAVSTHDFLQPGFDRSDCPVSGNEGSSGGLQTWDFMKAAQCLAQPVIMKLRTDVWFCQSSLDPLLRSVDRCVTRNIDVAYLGANVKHGFGTRADSAPSHHYKKVPDFVIVAWRLAVLGIDRVRERMIAAQHDVASGNRVFKIITENLDRSETTWCNILLVRKSCTVCQDWYVARDFVQSYPRCDAAMRYLDGCAAHQPL